MKKIELHFVGTAKYNTPAMFAEPCFNPATCGHHFPSTNHSLAVPAAVSDYGTVRYGNLLNFTRNEQKVGEIVKNTDGNEFVITRNEFQKGSASSPAEYWFEAEALT